MVKGERIHYSHRQIPILKGVNVDLEYGEILAIIGPNGAGKSTLLNILSNELKSEQVDFKKLSFSNWDTLELSRHKAKFSQHFATDIPLTVEEVVIMGRYPYFSSEPDEADWSAAHAAMAEVEISELGKRPYNHLSGGEKQRVHLARVLAQLKNVIAHKLLLLDEPLNNLDVKHQHLVLDIIGKLVRQGNSVVLVLHDLNLAAQYAHKILLMKEGKVLSVGKPEEVMTTEFLSAAYGFPAQTFLHPETGKRLIFFGDK